MAIGELVERLVSVFRGDMEPPSEETARRVRESVREAMLNIERDAFYPSGGESNAWTPSEPTTFGEVEPDSWESFRTYEESRRNSMAIGTQAPVSFWDIDAQSFSCDAEYYYWRDRQLQHEWWHGPSHYRYESPLEIRLLELAHSDGLPITEETRVMETEGRRCAVALPPFHVSEDPPEQIPYDINLNLRTVVDGRNYFIGYSEEADVLVYYRHTRYYDTYNHYLRTYDNYASEREAAEKALALLKDCLSEEQLRQFEESRTFQVTSSTGREYTITNARAYNVERGELKYCAEPMGVLPIYDKMLAQKMLLETNEEEFLRVANRKSNGYI